MWKKCAQSHSFGLGRVGVGVFDEPRTGIIYIYIYIYLFICVCTYTDKYIRVHCTHVVM